MRRTRRAPRAAFALIGALAVGLWFGLVPPVRAHDFSTLPVMGAAAGDDPNNPACNDEGAASTDAGATTSGPGNNPTEPVSPVTGNWVYRHVDLEVPGVFPIRLVRRYDSQSTYHSALGAGWAFTHDLALYEYTDGSVIVRNTCGQRHRYVPNIGSEGAFDLEDPSPAWRRTLERESGGEFVLRSPEGQQWRFDTAGRMTRIRDPQGNELAFTYSATKMPVTGTSIYSIRPETALTVTLQYRLERIDELLGSCTPGSTCRHVVFAYDASGLLESATSHDNREVAYGHDGTHGNLTSVTLPDGTVQTFGYGDGASPPTHDVKKNHLVTSVVEGQGMTEVLNTYASQTGLAYYRVTQQTIGTGVTSQKAEFNYAPTETPGAQSGQLNAASDWYYEGDPAEPSCAELRCTLLTHTIKASGQGDRLAKTLYKFDAAGHVIDVIDALGHQTVYVYESGRPFLDRILVYENTSGNAASPTRVLVRTTDLQYDTPGNLEEREVTVLTAANDTETITETWTYDGGWVSSHEIVSDARPSDLFRTEFTFERAGLVPGESGYDDEDPISNIHEIERLHFDDTPEVTTLDYNAHGRLARVELPDGHPIVWSYFTAGDNGGGVIRDGLVKQVHHETSGSGVDDHLKTQFDYNAQGLVATVTDARGNVTTLTWDASGRLEETTNAKGEKTILTYGGPNPAQPGRLLVRLERGRVESSMLDGDVTAFTYNGRGHLTAVRRKTGGSGAGETFASTTFVVDSRGLRLKVTDATQRELTNTYDLLGRLTSTTDEADHATSFGYDAVGNLMRITQVIDESTNFVREFTHDALDRLIQLKENDVDGSNDALTKFAYDAAGNLIAITDPEAHTTGYEVDGLSRLRFVTRPESEETEYRYDLRGRLDVTINARGQKLDHDYETWGPLAQVEHFSSESDPDADRAIIYGYDLSGNLLTVEDSAIAGTPASPGLVYEAVSPDAGDPYDALNRLRELETHLPGLDTRRLGYSYDRFGNRFGLIFFDGSEIFAHGYVHGDPATDARDRLQKAILPGMTESDPYVFGYLENDDLATVTRPSGVETALAYLDHGPIDTITTTDASMAALDLLDTSSRDGVDRILALVETFGGSGKTWAFEYGRAGRLTDATYPSGLGLPSTPEAFEYDLAGNREKPGDATAYEYSANHELITSPFDPVLCYDADGNLTSKRSSGDCTSGTVSETLTWDAANRLTQWTDGTETVSFVYDPFGRRMKKTSSTGGTTWYVWDGDQLLAEIDESTDARTVRYAYALGFAPAQVAFRGGQCADSVDNDGDGDTDHPDDADCASASADLEGPAPATDQCDDALDNDGDGLTDYAASGGDPDCTDPSDPSEAPLERIFDVHTDHLDTPRLLTDAEERAVWRAFPEAFGKAVVNEDPDGDGQDVSFNVRFPGQYLDAETGLHYNRFRYYDPEIGRYISADPIGRAGGPNLFAYAGSNPVRFADPSGLLFGGLINAGEAFGSYAAAYYAGITIDPCASGAAKAWAWAGGLLASLWTPETSDATAATLLTAWAISRALPAPGAVPGAEGSDQRFPDMAPEGDRGLGRKAPDQVTPGTREREGTYVDDKGNENPFRARYDEYGRQVERTDFTGNPDPTTHTNPHHHIREYGPGYGPKGKETNHPGPGPTTGSPPL